VVPALVILALWTALLGPGVARWLRQHRPTTSIASFHRQLRGLEHSGPRMAPAYGFGGTERSDYENYEQRREPERPKLVLLRSGATEKEPTMRDDGRYDDEYAEPRATTRRGVARADVWDDPWSDPFEDASFEDPRVDPPTRAYRTVRAPVAQDYVDDEPHTPRHAPTLSRDRARVRRSRILVALGAAIVGTFLLGLVPGLTILWALTVLGVVALAAYLGLMYYASNTGLYGATVSRTPVARVVMPAFRDDQYGVDDDDWAEDRIAAAQ
jgi:hypothetical protein